MMTPHLFTTAYGTYEGTSLGIKYLFCQRCGEWIGESKTDSPCLGPEPEPCHACDASK